ncbi:MAG: GFA family protein [Gammaproteobacteria bacterium]|nr:GFA family protein [Gammaproteobacteria bacterium]
MYKASCLCGAVKFHLHGTIKNIIFCHCSQCRKAQGSAFAANGIVNKTDFEFIQGENNLSTYESSPGQTRYFCTTCGAPIMSQNIKAPEQIRIRLGTIESDITEKPMAHIFSTSKANWEDICGDLPQYPEYEPGR